MQDEALSQISRMYEEHATHPSDINEHLPTLRSYARRVNSVAELGVRTGISSWAFLLGLAEPAAECLRSVPQAEKATLISVDQVWCNISAAARLGAALGVQHTFVQGNSARVELPPRDLLFIDTWHVYAHLRRELAAHHTTTGRYIVLQDTAVDGLRGESLRRGDDTAAQARSSGYAQSEIEAGLQQAVDEFLVAHPEWVVERHDAHNNGLTVLARSEMKSAQLEAHSPQMPVVFVVTSAIETAASRLTPEARLAQTHNTVTSVRRVWPAARIVLAEGGAPLVNASLHHAWMELLARCDLLVDLTRHSEMQRLQSFLVGEPVMNNMPMQMARSAMEMTLLIEAFEAVRTSGLLPGCSALGCERGRVFKLSGRYVLSLSSDPAAHVGAHTAGRYVFRQRVKSWLEPGGWSYDAKFFSMPATLLGDAVSRLRAMRAEYPMPPAPGLAFTSEAWRPHYRDIEHLWYASLGSRGNVAEVDHEQVHGVMALLDGQVVSDGVLLTYS